MKIPQGWPDEFIFVITLVAGVCALYLIGGLLYDWFRKDKI